MYESLFWVWGRAWGMMWKTCRSHFVSMQVNPWGATNYRNNCKINTLPSFSRKGYSRWCAYVIQKVGWGLCDPFESEVWPKFALFYCSNRTAQPLALNYRSLESAR